MILVPRKALWTQQPQQLVDVDWENPLSKGLILALTPCGVGYRDAVTGKFFPCTNTTHQRIATRSGMAVAAPTTGGGASFSYSPFSGGRTVGAIAFGIAGFAADGYGWTQPLGYNSGDTSLNRLYIDSSSLRVAKNYTVQLSKTLTAGAHHNVVYNGSSTLEEFYINGALDSSASHATIGLLSINRFTLSILRMPYLLWYGRTLQEKEAIALSALPMQVFRRQRERIWVPVSAGAPAGATLEGYAQAQASAAGNLTLSATLDGLALAVASASGNLTTQIPLAGAAVSVVSASGNLLTGIPLSAAAVAQATAAGNLTAQIRLDGAALAQAAASAGLTSAILLAGNAQGQAAASGTLAGGTSGLAGDAQAQASAVATLTTSIRLSGSAAAQAGVSGILTTAIPLTAAALASAIATGTLSMQIMLAGDAKARASASGTLAGTTVRPIPDDRFSAVISAREWSAVAEPRDYSVSAVDRTWEARL